MPIERRKNKPEKIIIHHTDVLRKDAPIQFWAVNRYHYENPQTNLGYASTLGYFGSYHIFIEPDGAELRYREDWEEGAHTKGENLTSLAVCLAGNFDMEMPTDKQLARLAARLKEWQAKYRIPDELVYFRPHRIFAPYKTCYGSLLADDWAFRLIAPVEKDDETKKKAEEIARLQNRIADLLRELILQLRIQLGILQARQKTSPGA